MEISDFEVLKRDLNLRGYSDAEIQELLNLPVLFIPGKLTPLDSEKPEQELTDQLVTVYKEIQKEGIKTRVAVDRNKERVYVEERHALIDLGVIAIGLHSLGNLADLTQILDFIITVIQLLFSKNKNNQLMPTVKYKLEIHNGEKSMTMDVEGQVDQLKELVPTEKVVKEIASKILK
jgi:hypothetical protein